MVKVFWVIGITYPAKVTIETRLSQPSYQSGEMLHACFQILSNSLKACALRSANPRYNA